MINNLHDALVGFVDFFYALVFAFIVQQAFDKVILEPTVSWGEKAIRLTIIIPVFYFLIWDWILGRILTFKNPYRSYSRFFFEILIAIVAYGAGKQAIDGAVSFLYYFSLVLLFGVFWAQRSSTQLTDRKDAREICIIQSLQTTGTVMAAIACFWWGKYVGPKATWAFALTVLFAIWSFIFVYEFMVPRYKGISAGPGVPFVSRLKIKRFRQMLLESDFS